MSSETRLTAEDRARLRATAEKATKGEWRHYPTGSYVMADTTKVCQLQDPWIRNDNQRADAAHIAAFHPNTALALLSEIERLKAAEAERDALKQQVDRMRQAVPTRVEIAALREFADDLDSIVKTVSQRDGDATARQHLRASAVRSAVRGFAEIAALSADPMKDGE